jgi:carbonic anhydrase
MEHVKSYPCAARAIADGKLRMHGLWFDVATADVFAYDEAARKFARVEGEWADELLARFD